MSVGGVAPVAAVDLQPIRHESWECPVCGYSFTSRELCRAGLDFIPLDPRPVRTKVRWKGKEEPLWQGLVTESRVINAVGPHGHRHIRWVTIKTGEGGGALLIVDESGPSRDLLNWEIVSEPPS